MSGVCYRPPDQEEAVDEAFLLQLQEVLSSQALVLMGDFNHPDICWDSGMVGGRQSRRFLESVEDNFLVQVIDGPTVSLQFIGGRGGSLKYVYPE